MLNSLPPAVARPLHAAICADEPVAAAAGEDADAIRALHDAIMRYIALRLLGWGMREKDVHYLCAVSDYYLGKVAGALLPDSLDDGAVARRGRGAGAGVWSICRSRKVRREAAMFVADWLVAGQPFGKQPRPIEFESVYQRYRDWGWKNGCRDWLEPSTCLAIIRNIRSGELLLYRCVMCERLSIQALNPDCHGRSGSKCSYCESPHTIYCSLTPDHRVLKPA